MLTWPHQRVLHCTRPFVFIYFLIWFISVFYEYNIDCGQMAASPPLFCSCTPRIVGRRYTNSVNHHNPALSSSSPCSPSPYSSHSNFSSHRPGRCWNFITFSGSLLSLSLSLKSYCNVLEIVFAFGGRGLCCQGFHYFVIYRRMELWNFWSFVIGVLVFYCKPSSYFSF